MLPSIPKALNIVPSHYRHLIDSGPDFVLESAEVSVSSLSAAQTQTRQLGSIPAAQPSHIETADDISAQLSKLQACGYPCVDSSDRGPCPRSLQSALSEYQHFQTKDIQKRSNISNTGRRRVRKGDIADLSRAEAMPSRHARTLEIFHGEDPIVEAKAKVRDGRVLSYGDEIQAKVRHGRILSYRDGDLAEPNERPNPSPSASEPANPLYADPFLRRYEPVLRVKQSRFQFERMSSSSLKCRATVRSNNDGAVSSVARSSSLALLPVTSFSNYGTVPDKRPRVTNPATESTGGLPSESCQTTEQSSESPRSGQIQYRHYPSTEEERQPLRYSYHKPPLSGKLHASGLAENIESSSSDEYTKGFDTIRDVSITCATAEMGLQTEAEGQRSPVDEWLEEAPDGLWADHGVSAVPPHHMHGFSDANGCPREPIVPAHHICQGPDCAQAQGQPLYDMSVPSYRPEESLYNTFVRPRGGVHSPCGSHSIKVKKWKRKLLDRLPKHWMACGEDKDDNKENIPPTPEPVLASHFSDSSSSAEFFTPAPSVRGGGVSFSLARQTSYRSPARSAPVAGRYEQNSPRAYSPIDYPPLDIQFRPSARFRRTSLPPHLRTRAPGKRLPLVEGSSSSDTAETQKLSGEASGFERQDAFDQEDTNEADEPALPDSVQQLRPIDKKGRRRERSGTFSDDDVLPGSLRGPSRSFPVPFENRDGRFGKCMVKSSSLGVETPEIVGLRLMEMQLGNSRTPMHHEKCGDHMGLSHLPEPVWHDSDSELKPRPQPQHAGVASGNRKRKRSSPERTPLVVFRTDE